MDLSKYDHKIFTLGAPDFAPVALDIFRLQYAGNPVYHEYINALGVDPSSVKRIEQIPFLPIGFFKSHSIRTTAFEPEMIFESSGTTGSINSRHLVKDLALYQRSFVNGWKAFYGEIEDWCIIGLLPSYLERRNSSLVYMVNELVHLSGHLQSGFYLDEYERLFDTLQRLEEAGQKTLLIGVTFALLDFAEKYSLTLNHTIVMETGGMKGRREEMIREEVHSILKNAFHTRAIHSEYGMTELLSQAYSKGDGLFRCPPWMRVLIRDDEDPLHVRMPGLQASIPGAINVIDLANIYSCSFIATDDAGRLHDSGSFSVLGRLDNSDLRGCSLMTV